MSNLSDSNRTKRNRFTRMCIGEALISLMEQNDYDSIKISDIVVKAGISRMTYYNYYHSKTDILEDYLQEMVAEYLRSVFMSGVLSVKVSSKNSKTASGV